jgi:hypothetical protein
MRSRIVYLIVVLSVAIQLCSAQQSARGAQASPNYGRMPLTFEPSQGQTDPQVKFLSRGKGYTAFLMAGGMVLSLRASEVGSADTIPNNRIPAQKHASSRILRFTLVGASVNATIVGEDRQPGHVNYFIGNDKSKWHTNVPTFGRVRYKNVYPGIDIVYYGSHSALEYDFDVSPGVDPSCIQFEIEGADQIKLDPDGNLILEAGASELHFQSPHVYQESNGSRLPLHGEYVLSSPTRIGFHVANFDSGKQLVIDPTLVYSSYLGGSGDDRPTGIAVDGNGNVYVAGYTDSTDFPVATLGSLPSGNDHVFVAKFDSTGSNLVYADYIGGNSQDYGYALALDSGNEVWVTGSTASSNFPVVNAYQATYPGSFNAFLTKFSSDGSNLLYSTYFGGNGSDLPTSIALDGLAEVLVAGNTSSTNFPVANAFQSTVAPNQGGYYGTYGFVTKFSPDGSSLVYSTYFTGTSNVAYNCSTPCWGEPYNTVQSLAADASGNAYLAGTTDTYNFPTTSDVYLTANSTQLNQEVGFVAKLNASGTPDYSTYFYETSGYTVLTGIAVDASGSAYVTGLAASNEPFPITSTSICDPSVYGPACSFAFVTKFDAAAATLLYSTFLGPNNYATPATIVLDQNNDAYVLATTSSNSFAEVNGIEGYAGGNDILLTEIDPVAGSQLFATYLGGSADEFATAMALDSAGNLYLTGTTDSSDFPTTPAGFQLQLGGNTDAFIMKISDSSIPSPTVSLNPYALEYSSQSIGTTSQAQQVLLRNMSSSPLTVASISTTGDFAETDNCGTSVPAAGSCSLSVTFTPTTAGTNTGSLVLSDNATGSPQSVALSGTVVGSVAVLTPGSLTFPNVSVGASSGAQVVTLTNQGNASLNISGIQITGDYGQTNNCPSSLLPGANCAFNVIFIPTASGNRTGTLEISDDAVGSPQTVALSGVGLGAVVVLTPAMLTFPSTQVGSSSASQAVTVANRGNANLNIGNIQITGDYQQTNTCPGSLAAGTNCAVNITFTPTVSGIRAGTLSISDNAGGSPQIVELSGAGSDFSLTASPGSDTVNPGSVAIYTLTATPVGGTFNSAIKLSCGGVPANATCTLSTASVTPGATAATAVLVVSTTAASVKAANLRRQKHLGYAIWVQLASFGLFAMFVMRSKRWRNKDSTLIALGLVVPALVFMSACAGGTGIVPTGGSGTAPGTYTITVKGASGSLQHSMALSLIVQ